MKKLFLLSAIILGFVGLNFAQHTIAVEIKTDNYGSETSWKVVNSITSEVIGSGGPYTNISGGAVYNAEFDVSGEDCYWFYIYDAFGDGICAGYGTGYYKVWYDGVLIKNACSFTDVAMVKGMGDGCPEREIALEELDIQEYGLFNEEISIKGTVRNEGTETLENFKVKYKVNDEEYVEEYTKHCYLALDKTISFTHNIPFKRDVQGNYNITIVVSEPNGFTDNEADNVLETSIYVNENSVPRTTLLEHFTTAQCPNCPAATTNITNWLSIRPNIIWLSHHSGFYTDVFTNALNNTLLAFFNSSGTYAPAIMLDRKFYSPDNEPGPVFFPVASYTPALIDRARNRHAFVSVDMEGTFNPNTRQLVLTVSGEFVGNVQGDDPRLSVYIAENNLPGTQSGGGSNYIHNHVVRGAISQNWGDSDAIADGNQGTSYSKTYTYTVDSNWKIEDTYIVAFVSNFNNSTVNDREVHNASMMNLTDFTYVSANTNRIENLRIFPNPANDIINIANIEGASIE
ncbi:MAG: Omp28-related outer membrane protein, partial [Bacteroidales bacterium]|nr:Omp28-related outer membrane protein [Bacteroidales bacterium]